MKAFSFFLLLNISLVNGFSQDSTYITKWEDGSIRENIGFTSGVRDGISREFNKKGEIINEEYYEKEEKVTTIQYEYYNHIKGLLYSQKIFLGEVIIEGRNFLYKDNNRFLQTLYHPNGKKKSKGTLFNGLPDGKWEYFDNDGKFLRAIKFKMGNDVKAMKEVKRQGKFFPATIVTKKGEKIIGEVKKIDSTQSNINGFPFWDKNKKRWFYAPYSITSLKTQGFDFESIDLKQAPCIGCVKQILLTKLIDGPMVLYCYKHVKLVGGVSPLSLSNTMGASTCINYYYVRKKGDTSALMVMKKHCYKGTMRTISQPNFKKFYEYFDQAPELQHKIESKEYNRKRDLEKIVQEYNDHFK